MNQDLIGKFLAEERRKKGYTQKQLADILIISDKTISKWETGKSLPDLEMMNRLCQTFDISINELLSGERIPTEELEFRTEENIKGLILENEHNRKNNHWNITIGLSVLFLSLLLVVISLMGTEFAKFIWYVDVFSIIAIMGILTALRLLSKNIQARESSIVEKCTFPVGVMMAVINMIAMLNSTTDIYLKNIATCILPILYSSIIYIVLQCLKNRKVHK